jgi:hypothetical protein
MRQCQDPFPQRLSLLLRCTGYSSEYDFLKSKKLLERPAPGEGIAEAIAGRTIGCSVMLEGGARLVRIRSEVDERYGHSRCQPTATRRENKNRAG